MRQTEEALRNALQALADEATMVTELDPNHAASKGFLARATAPVASALIAAAIVSAFVLVSQSLDPSSSQNPASPGPGDEFRIDYLASGGSAGVILELSYTTLTPIRITAVSLDPNLVAGDPEGELYDNTVAEPSAGFDQVDAGPDKQVSLNFRFVPQCSTSTTWVGVDLQIESDAGTYQRYVETPRMPKVVSDWCALPMQVSVGMIRASGDMCQVQSDFQFTNPGGRGATITLNTPGWHAQPLVIDEGSSEGVMVVSSNKACDLPRDSTQFSVEYSDGTVSTVRGPTPTHQL